MSTPLLSLLLAQLLASPLDDAPAVEFRYSGTLSQVARGGAAEPVKQFEVWCLLQRRDGDARELAFVVDEGADGWPWPERFGMVGVDAQHRPTGTAVPRVLYEHEKVEYPLPLPFPLFEHAGRLKEGAEWTEGRTTYEVPRRRRVADRDCWQVDVAGNLGRSQTLWIEAGTPLLVASQQQVVMGRGDRFTLSLELDALRPVEETELARIRRPLDTLRQLQKDLDRRENDTRPELNDEQIETALASLEPLAEQAQATPLNRLAVAIARDVRSQRKRSGDVESLAKKHVGRPAPELTLKGLDGRPIDAAEHDGKIVVLHFWKYNDEPLKEPYGQVGYLDFLNNRRGRVGVRIYGVAVDPQFSEPARAAAAVRQVRKLREFMNLSYPVTLDDGTLLEKFGDPRTVGAPLPLWVVIAPDGRIVHYKAGFYDIKPDEGLRQLDELLIEEIRKQRTARDEG